MPDCNTCKMKRTEPENVPYLVHETAMARAERQIKRMWIALIVAIAFVFVSNVAWLYAWMQYDYESYEIVAEGDSNANYIGQDGDIYNGSESFGTETQEEEASRN